MHVDGATVRQIYVAPDEVIFGGRPRGQRRQSRTSTSWSTTRSTRPSRWSTNTTVAVAARALSTILKREGRNNVLSSYAYAAAHGIGYHLAFIDADAPDRPRATPPSSSARIT